MQTYPPSAIQAPGGYDHSRLQSCYRPGLEKDPVTKRDHQAQAGNDQKPGDHQGQSQFAKFIQIHISSPKPEILSFQVCSFVIRGRHQTFFKVPRPSLKATVSGQAITTRPMTNVTKKSAVLPQSTLTG